MTGIAIIGMAGRFPGAPSVRAFWDNLCAGVESIRPLDAAQLEDAFDAAARSAPNFVRARGILDDVDRFDAGFFGMHAREAELTDPQHRLFLECCWEALEDGGYDPAAFDGAIGVYGGSSINTYLMRHVLGDRAGIAAFTGDYQVGSFPELVGSGTDFLATRVAYKLNLRGPAMTVQSACSTSLLAVAQAAQTLLLGQADMMLAGAMSISLPQQRGYLYQDGGMVSADGHCRTFDARADGTVFGAGGGVVLLRRLDDAIAAGDTIYAVIRGFGITNDGAAKVGYTAPSVEGQSTAISRAHAMAGVDPATIGYVECHGTATPLGDPIELAALGRAFGSGIPSNSCALGSVKPNVGHLDVAAGMSGLIKTALAVQHGTIPPTLHFETANPRLRLDASPFYVNTHNAPWPHADAPRRAGVSAFGVGGTNVHLVLEAAPEPARPAADDAPQLLVLSARSEAALAAARTQLAEHLAGDGAALADVAFTLQQGRRAFPYRSAIVAATAAEARAALTKPFTAAPRTGALRTAFLFPGQGAQYVGMGRDLYARLPVFRAALDRCAAILEPLLGTDLRALLHPTGALNGHVEELTSTRFAQPAIFSISYALAQVWLDWGIEPEAMLGHSVGEFVAAHLAGVFSLEDGLMLVAERGRLMQSLPAGAMLAVRLGADELRPLLDASLDLAAVNSTALSVVAGPFGAISAFEAALAERNVAAKRLATSHAFHSAMLDPVLPELEARFAQIRLNAPQRPYVSSATGTWIEAAQATSPAYWARHCRETVRFADGVATLLDAGTTAFVEAGPGRALTGFATQVAGRQTRVTAVASLPSADDAEDASLLAALGSLWTAGAAPAWTAVQGTRGGHRVPLPTYPFERKRYWIDPPAGATAPGPLAVIADSEEPSMELAPPAAADDAALQRTIVALLEELSGEELSAADTACGFLELGFDSLFLGRFVQQLQARIGVSVTFRQLLSDLPTIDALTRYAATVVAPSAIAAPAPANPAPQATSAPLPAGSLEAVLRDGFAAMQQMMLEQLQRAQAPAAPAHNGGGAVSAPRAASAIPGADEGPSRFDAFKIGGAVSTDLTPAQRAHVAELIATTVARTAGSKELTQRYRSVLADPRVAAGFRAEWKEMVYPITVVRAEGAHLWDVDGNEYVDLLNGFGQTAFGHAPDFVVDAVTAQLGRGFAIGPQTELAGEVATLFCELTGNERVTFCNTGSEAVMAALRLARTVTGRNRVLSFAGAYHGQFDEVLVKGARNGAKALPVAPGIPFESVANMTVLPYATPESLAWVREHAHELAAVIVEPVQSRHPDLQPKDFLTELRAITAASGTALVFDEVVTGFRMHPGGMQAVFGVRADMATYGKVVGGGMPIGILAGCARFMDALDGGMWQYGDASSPDVPPTFFAGTFVRHPLVMAAVLAVLKHLRAQGPELQAAITARTAGLVARLNAALAERGIATRIESYGSLFYCNFVAEDRLSGLLFYHLRARGIYIQEGFPCFLTTAHTAADCDRVVAAFVDSLDALQTAGIFGGARVAIPSAPREVALTEEQTEIWLSAQLGDDASCAFNESVTVRLRGAFDERAFARALDAVLARHDALRAAFAPTGEAMIVAPTAQLAMTHVDLSTQPGAPAEAELEALIARDARTPFDLVAGPLVRAQLVTLGPDERAVVLTAHHIICDGWSMNVVLDELAAEYAAQRAGTPSALPAPLSFATYAERQHARPAAELAAVEGYWLERFATPVSPLELPTDRPRPARKTFNGATRSLQLGADTYRTIKKAGARRGCTLFVTLLTAFETLAGRLAGANDVVVGVPAAGQSLLENEILVGHCVDFLPIRSSWTPDTTLADLLATTKRHVLDAYEHQQYTLGTLVRTLAPVRDATRVPLAEIQFNLERISEGVRFDGATVDVTPNPKAFVTFDLFLNVIESDAGLRLDCDYNTDLFDAATIDRWLQYYTAILDAVVADADTRVDELAFLPAGERAALAGGLDDTRTPYPDDAVLHELIAAQAAAQPDARAVIDAGGELSYGELERQANALAHLLRARVGESTAPVGVLIARSARTLVALLATLKAGYAYLPLDPAHPPARLRMILEDAGAVAALVDARTDGESLPPGVTAIDCDREAATLKAMPTTAPAIARSATDLAYTIFTSGSTGRPKGVEITHRSLINLLCAMAREPGIERGDVLLAVTTIAFDIAALELFVPLISGATVAIAGSDDTADGFRLLARLKAVRANVMQATPATWRMLLDAGFRSRPGLRMLCGGEALHADLAAALLAGGGELWNMYGPTETTVWSSCAKIVAGAPVTIGKPIANTQFYVLDANDRQAPVGTLGELHIGGDGVARGYVGLPELTAQKFIPNPFGSGRLYRTGDLARIAADGSFDVAGRIDHQVKLRGFRIELGEIEAALAKTGRLAGVAVSLREDVLGAPRLVAYCVPRAGETIASDALRAALAQDLPDYMLPAAWVTLTALPLSPNGKIDRAALPAPELAPSAGDAFAAPETPTEIALAAIWTSVLGRDAIGIDEDLFALGADSIQIFRITANANRAGLPLMAKQMIAQRTIAKIARELDRLATEPATQVRVPFRASARPALRPQRVEAEVHRSA